MEIGIYCSFSVRPENPFVPDCHTYPFSGRKQTDSGKAEKIGELSALVFEYGEHILLRINHRDFFKVTFLAQ